MRARLLLVTSLAWALVGAAGCGSSPAPTAVTVDGGPDADASGDAAEVELDASGDVAAIDAPGDAETDAPVEVGGDAGVEVAPDGASDVSDVPSPSPDAAVDVAKEAASDGPVVKPPATATWTIAPNAACAAAGAGCMDTGSVGGYQITASGSCPNASSLQLWFPGGASPLAAGTYAVKPAAGILDVISMPAGMVGVTADRDDSALDHFKYWGRSGTITVVGTGTSRHVTFTGVSLREMTSGAMTTLAADVTCP